MDFGQWRREVAALDPDLLTGDECASVVVELAQLRKACDAALARLAVKAEAAQAHARRGFVDAADWLASTSGTNTTEARRAIDTAAGVGACPNTEHAWRAGHISAAQAAEIVNTEKVRPGAEAELLPLARTKPLRVLKEQAQHQRLTAIDAHELRGRQRKARHLRHWQDELGMTRISGALVPEVGAALLSRIDQQAEQLRREARRHGQEETWEAHAADALAALVIDEEGKTKSSSDVVFVCDLNAYRRGQTVHGEICHVVNRGPVPIDVVKDAVDRDAFVKVVLHDGVRIHTVKHFGRHINAELRTALDLGPAPQFLGQRCGCGCGKRYKLQIDHIDPVAHGGATEWQNLQPLVATEHTDKTRRDRKAGKLRAPPPNLR